MHTDCFGFLYLHIAAPSDIEIRCGLQDEVPTTKETTMIPETHAKSLSPGATVAVALVGGLLLILLLVFVILAIFRFR